MHLFYHKIHFLITGTILFLTACEKDELEPLFSEGILKGTTYYFDETVFHGGPLPLDNVTIKAKGPYGSKTALTNADGEYEINNLGNGTYEIEFLKEGWGALKYYSVQIYGNEVLTYDQRMWKRPEFAMPVLEFQTEEDNGEYVTFRSNLPAGASEVPPLRAFFSKTSDVSCIKYDYTSAGDNYVAGDHFYYRFNAWDFPNQQGYIIIYLCAFEDQGVYGYDYFLDVVTFPSIDPKKHSQVFKFQ
jgi:hypothetical protein